MARDGLRSLRSFEGPAFFEAFAEEKQRNSDDQNPDGNRGPQRPVKRCAKEALYDVGDHGAGRAADEKRREKVTERKTERKCCSCQQTRHGEREDHAQKSLNRAGAQILRGFHERPRDMFERSVNGKKNERRVNVRQQKHDGERAVKEKANRPVGEMEVLKKAVQHAVAAENGLPGVTAHQIADPQGHDHKLIEKFLARVESQVVREGIAEQKRTKRDGSGDAHGAEKHFSVERIREESFVIAPIPLVNDNALGNGPKTVCKNKR